MLPSFNKVNKLKSSGLNLGAGRAVFSSSSSQTACSLLASWSLVIWLVVLVLQTSNGTGTVRSLCHCAAAPLPLHALPWSVSCLSHLSWTPHPSMHIRMLSTDLPIYNEAGCAVVRCAADHTCIAWFTLLSSWAATSQQPAPGGTNGGFGKEAKPGPIWFWFPFSCHCATPSMSRAKWNQCVDSKIVLKLKAMKGEAVQEASQVICLSVCPSVKVFMLQPNRPVFNSFMHSICVHAIALEHWESGVMGHGWILLSHFTSPL